MRIYTRTGDQGQTSLYNGDRKPKTDPLFELLGQIDHLNAQIGLAISQLHLDKTKESILKTFDFLTHWPEVQGQLMNLSAIIARAESPEKTPITSDSITHLEQTIDLLWHNSPPLKNLILPGGSILGSQLHIIRTEIRQVEIKVLNLTPPNLSQHHKTYLNRLSDYFFACARFINHESQTTELIW